MEISFRHLFTELQKDESGQDLVEYALIAAIVGLGTAAAMRGVATEIASALATVGSRLTASV